MLDPTIRTRFLHLPTQQQQLQNMQECYAKYKLPNIIGGIDGCHIPFLERPRQIPGGRDHVAFINRKGMYSINAQIVGGIDRKIYDIQLSSPGSYHDSATYTISAISVTLFISLSIWNPIFSLYNAKNKAKMNGVHFTSPPPPKKIKKIIMGQDFLVGQYLRFYI